MPALRDGTRLRLGCGAVVMVLALAWIVWLETSPPRWDSVLWVLLPDGDVIEYGWLYPGGWRQLCPLWWGPECQLVWRHGGAVSRCGSVAAFRGSGELRATPDLRGIWCAGAGELFWLDRSTGEMGIDGQTLQPTPRWALGGGILLATEKVDPP